uniref:Cystatin domain-containing protein n=1 Tax=Leptobrachium leishanense TaxID=445787 RepID=A0A8C5P6S1_9ANUR
MHKCGGLGKTMEATSEVQALCDQVKVEVEQKCEKNFTKFVAICYKTQVVCGTNYFVKIDTGVGFIHVRIYVALPHTKQPPSFDGVQQDKTREDEIHHF